MAKKKKKPLTIERKIELALKSKRLTAIEGAKLVKKIQEHTTNEKAGSPKKFKPEFCDQLILFFDVSPWETLNGRRVYKRMPTIEGFAKHVNICTSTIYNWLEPKNESFESKFLDAFKKAQICRKNWLTDVGLSGIAPPASFKFVAVNVTDMRDKQETEHGVTKGMEDLLKTINGQTRGLPE